jgi:hypothetical protein
MSDMATTKVALVMMRLPMAWATSTCIPPP